MTTMRLHRLHFSSNPSPRTLAMSWPHSHRVSEAAASISRPRSDMWNDSLILRTIIKIVCSIGSAPSACQEALRGMLLPSGKQSRIICL